MSKRYYLILLVLYFISCIIFSAFSLVLASASDLALDFNPKKLDEVSKSRYWHLLLHYDKTFWGSYRSAADGMDFFFSKDGKTDPYKELVASLNSFHHENRILVGRTLAHPQCAFPERYRFLKEQFHLNYKDIDCPDFREWKKGLKGDSVTIVFASSYPYNPSSVFGHTFLKINGKDNNKILNYALNFSAMTGNDEIGGKYALMGLMGGYEGRFSLLPYFMKINEYAHMERRDLWEYEIKIDKEEIDRMLGHVWELETNTYFDYFFLDENCSFMLLKLLEMAHPDWHLSEDFPLWVIPIETVKSLERVGAISDVHLRPSLFRRFMFHESNLSSKEKIKLSDTLKGKEDLHLLSTDIIDTSILYFDYRKKYKEGQLPPDEASLFTSLLRERSTRQEKMKSEEIIYEKEKEERPDYSHSTSAIKLGLGHEKNQGDFFNVRLKTGVHDFFNKDTGYLPFSQLDFLWLDTRFYLKKIKKIHLLEVGILNVMALNTYNGFSYYPSYLFDSKWRQETGPQVSLGVGATFEFFPSFLSFAFLSSRLETKGKGTLALIPELGLAYNILNNGKFMLREQWEQRYQPHLKPFKVLVSRFGASLFVHKNTEARFELKSERGQNLRNEELELSLLRMF